MKEYFWIINQLDCVPQVGNLQNVVTTVHWTYKVKEGDNYGSINGSSSFDAQEVVTQKNFVPTENLSQKDVEGWLENSLDMVALQDVVEHELSNCLHIINTITNPFQNENQQSGVEPNQEV
jgi:hypothetical protein